MKNYKTFMQERVKMLIYIRQSNLKQIEQGVSEIFGLERQNGI